MRRFLPFILVVACGGGSGSGSSGGQTLTVQASSGSSLNIAAPGGTTQLEALRHEGDAYGGGTFVQVVANWSSANTAVATVDGTGLVTGVAGGTSVITAESGGSTGRATVTVGAAAASITIEWSLSAQATAVSTTVAAGTPVKWHAVDATHSVVADTAPPPDTVTISQGTTSAPQTITAKGTYHYHCSIHPAMKGTLIVQ